MGRKLRTTLADRLRSCRRKAMPMPGVNCTSDRGVRPASGSDKMYLLSTTWPSVALVVFNSGADACTSTDVATVPTVSCTFTVASCCTWSSKGF